MGTNEQIAMWDRVKAMAEAMGPVTPSTVCEGTQDGTVELAAAYMIACERMARAHHPEYAPRECFDACPETDAHQAAHDAMWDAIGEPNTHRNLRYVMAWEVWGAWLEIDRDPADVEPDEQRPAPNMVGSMPTDPNSLAALKWAVDQIEDFMDPDHCEALDTARKLIERTEADTMARG